MSSVITTYIFQKAIVLRNTDCQENKSTIQNGYHELNSLSHTVIFLDCDLKNAFKVAFKRLHTSEKEFY